MSDEFDPKALRLTPEERLEIDEGATHGEYAENLITATLLKAADWIAAAMDDFGIGESRGGDYAADKLREAAEAPCAIIPGNP